ncbi:GPW/gp25 family protein [Mesorhizobium sp. IMUNJ 23232]|uniref:GPW/gp25 family protein n=1 Tax=Mesorhizobium sp. IMUNJ 23232 TaxID=3376064 RepID=UPI00379A837D
MEHDRIAYPIAIDPGAGGLKREPDYERYVKQLIIQVLMTAHGERINRPDFGASVRRLVFAPLAAGISTFVQAMILQALNRWLSDVIRVEAIKVDIIMEEVRIEVTYVILARGDRRYLSMEVTP